MSIKTELGGCATHIPIGLHVTNGYISQKYFFEHFFGIIPHAKMHKVAKINIELFYFSY